jgi:hypothetical protein
VVLCRCARGLPACSHFVFRSVPLEASDGPAPHSFGTPAQSDERYRARGDRMPPRGRPSAFTPELALRVRKLLSEGWPVTSICRARRARTATVETRPKRSTRMPLEPVPQRFLNFATPWDWELLPSIKRALPPAQMCQLKLRLHNPPSRSPRHPTRTTRSSSSCAARRRRRPRPSTTWPEVWR